MKILQLHLRWDWNWDRSIGLKQTKFDNHAGAGDKTDKPS